MTNIVVAGAGYVGLANAVMLARHHHVCLVDVVSSKVDSINRGISPIADAMIEDALATGNLDLKATVDGMSAYAVAEVVLIATPTNYDEQTQEFDTSSVEAVYRAIRSVNRDCVVVIKSTVPIGYTAGLCAETGDQAVVFSPEFLREGKALYDCLHPSRVIVGFVCDSSSHRYAEAVAELFSKGAVDSDVKTLVMHATEAEAVKLFANTYLALRVSFFNELDTFASVRGLDAGEIVKGVCLDPRVGDFYNNPSFGYGGYCLPKDTKQLLANYRDVPQNLIRAIVDSNQTRISYIAEKLLENGPSTVGIYRLVMKTGSDNFRQSSIRRVIAELHQKDADVLIYEPMLDDTEYEGCAVEKDFTTFAERCDVIAANRMTDELQGVKDKVFTRDLFARD